MSGTLDSMAGLSLDEKRQLLAALLVRKAEKERSALTPVHRLFEEQVARTPAATALVGGDERLTYQELNARANRLAHRLRALGVGPETLVGLCLERSSQTVIGLLGILKAGGAYLPLDPAFPPKRLVLMLEDAQAPVLVTEQHLRETLPESAAQVVCIDSEWEGLEREPAANLGTSASSGHLAYVIYTSGSTGRPKGVQITHEALSNFLLAMRALLGLTERDTLLAVTTVSFDIAALELFLPLIQGAVLEVAGRDLAADGLRLAARLAQNDITFLQATPATWRMLLDAGWSGTARLTMLCGGEALPRDLADRLLPNGKSLWNLYGPTETTIWSSAAQVDAEGPITIGRPIARAQLHVLDAQLQLVPPGVVGELYIGGLGVARGYLDRPALTAERFLPDPYSGVPGSRLYRTGDLARARADGTVECLGRVDHQVKIRGFRIELGEIETQLRRHEAVREAVVVARGESILVGYVVPHAGQVPTAPLLRAALRETLPEYMVPTRFVTLDALPLTPNGKVDRNALPDPAPEQAAQGPGHVPPRGPVAEALVQFWSELLGRSRVGIHDNFFDVGGHSLLATQVLARVRDAFGVEPTLQELLDEPTVAGLAARVEALMRAQTGVPTVPIRPVPRNGPLPASFAQQRLWFLDQLEPNSPLYNIPVGVRLTGVVDPWALARALNEVIRRHEALRTTFDAPEGTPRQVIAPRLEIDLPLCDLSGLSTAEREAESQRIILDEATRPFDLAHGPLIRARLVRLDAAEHVALVTIHHIVTDAWSMGVLTLEVAALYDALLQGRPSTLPEPVLQYADYAAWQRAWLAGDSRDALTRYWVDQLHGLPTLALPADRSQPAAPTGRGSARTLDLPAALLQKARDLGRQEKATLYMTLLAAYQVLLHRYSGQDDFAVGSPIAGRTRSELANVIGFFVNTLVLRADVSGRPTFRTLLQRVRQTALAAYAHQDLPYEQLVAVLQGERESGRTPLFQTLFALQNAPLPALEAPGLTLSVFEPGSGTAKFDLALFAIESGDGLRLEMQYRTDLFDAATIDQLLAHFRALLEGALENPDHAVGTLPMLSDKERLDALPPSDVDLDGLTDDEVDALLQRLESGVDAQRE